MLRIQILLAITILVALTFLGCGNGAATVTQSTQQAQQQQDLVFAYEQHVDDVAITNQFSIECFAINSDGSTRTVPGCPTLQGTNATQFCAGLHARGGRLYLSSVPNQIAIYQTSPLGITLLSSAPFAGYNSGGDCLFGLTTDAASGFLYGLNNGQNLEDFQLHADGTFSLATPSPVDWSQVVGIGQLGNIDISGDGKTAIVSVSYDRDGAVVTADSYARDPQTGQLSALQPPSSAPAPVQVNNFFSGVVIGDGSYYIAVGGDPGTYGLYRINPDSSLTNLGNPLAGYARVLADPSGKFIFALRQDSSGSSVSLDTYIFDTTKLSFTKTSELPVSDLQYLPLRVSESGRFMFVGTPDAFTATSSSFKIYSIDPQTGSLAYRSTIHLKARAFQFEVGSAS